MSPRKTFKVGKARSFVGSALGEELGNYTAEELEAMVQNMEDFYAEEEAAGQAQTESVQGPEGEGAPGTGPGEAPQEEEA